MQIRRATLEDAESLSALSMDVQRLHAEALPQLFKIPEDGFALAFMREHLPDPLNYFFIANLEGEDTGYVFARLMERAENPFMHAWRYLLIDQISVKPAYQRKGFGRRLIEKVRFLAGELGVDTILLDTWYFNEQAQAFFRKQGFVTFDYRMWIA